VNVNNNNDHNNNNTGSNAKNNNVSNGQNGITDVVNKDKNKDKDTTDNIVNVTILGIFSMILGIINSVFLFYTQHFLLNNIVGITTSIHGITFVNPGSYYNATVLLSLLFFL